MVLSDTVNDRAADAHQVVPTGNMLQSASNQEYSIQSESRTSTCTHKKEQPD